MTMNLRKYFGLPLRDTAGGDGGGAQPPQGGGGAPPPPPTPSTGGAGGGSPPPPAPPAAPPTGGQSWSMPQGFPDRLKAETQEAFFANLQKDWQEQHSRLSSLPQPGKATGDYLFQPSDKAKAYAGDLAKDPVYSVAQKAALEAGVPVETFSKFMGSLYDGLVDGKFFAEPRNIHAERLDYLGKTGSDMGEEQAIAAIKPEIERLSLFVDGFAQQSGLDEKGNAALGMMLETGPGMKALNALAKALKAPGVQPGGGDPGGGGVTHAQLKARQADPRGDRNSVSYEPAFAQETDRMYRQLFG